MRRSGFASALLLAALLPAGCARVAPVPAPAPAAAVAPLRIETLHLAAAEVAPGALRVRVYLPPGYDPRGAGDYPVLYLNDGQDMEAVQLQDTLATLYAQGAIRPLIAVAIDMPPDRMGAYGLSDRAHARSVVAATKYGPVGTRAQAYCEWLAHTLVPAIDARYRTRSTPAARAVLGWSLGGLQAFGLGWQYPELFGRVGAFSPSFWLASDRSDAQAAQRTRLAQRMVAQGTPPRGQRFYFAVGTDEDSDDRDGDGINDALDDTRDLVDGWYADGTLVAPGLRQRGFRVDLDGTARATHRADATLAVLAGGQHNQQAWARMLPGFLRWAYAAPERR